MSTKRPNKKLGRKTSQSRPGSAPSDWDSEITWAEPEGVFRHPDNSAIFMSQNDLINRKDICKEALYAQVPEPEIDLNPNYKHRVDEEKAKVAVGVRGLRMAPNPEILGPGLGLGYEDVTGRDAYQDLFVPEVRNIDQIRGRPIMPHYIGDNLPSATVPWRCDANDSQVQKMETLATSKRLQRSQRPAPGTYRQAAEALIRSGDTKSLREALRMGSRRTEESSAAASQPNMHHTATTETVRLAQQSSNTRTESMKVQESNPETGPSTGDALRSGQKPSHMVTKPQKPLQTAILRSQEQPVTQKPAQVSSHIQGRQISTSAQGRMQEVAAPLGFVADSHVKAVPEKQIVRVRPNLLKEGMDAPGKVSNRISHGSERTHVERVRPVRERMPGESRTGVGAAPQMSQARHGRDLNASRKDKSTRMAENSHRTVGPQKTSYQQASPAHKDSRVLRKGTKASGQKQKIGMNLRFGRGNQYELMESSAASDSDSDYEDGKYAYYTR